MNLPDTSKWALSGMVSELCLMTWFSPKSIKYIVNYLVTAPVTMGDSFE